MSTTIAVYPGSFDPITNGHLDIVTRASKIFDRVIMGVYEIPDKNLLFTTDERVELATKSCTHLKNVEVCSFGGLTVDFVKKRKAQVIVRGLRAGADFDHEFDMAMMNKYLRPDVELVCFMSSFRYQFLSSSLLKEVASLKGNIDTLVPTPVIKALKQKISQGKL
ncbi:MAG: pantetheine-phosphate adenylyltransferase [Dehalococcoidales bacterium]|nr:pantetheine-phosphate adenylyltransferase [Dehalococcoidales bacterium]